MQVIGEANHNLRLETREELLTVEHPSHGRHCVKANTEFGALTSLSLPLSLSRAGRKRRKPDTPSLARERAPVVHYLSLPLLLPQGSSLSLLQHGQGSVTRDRPPARIRALGN